MTAFAYSVDASEAEAATLLAALERRFRFAILESVTEVRFVAVARPPDGFSLTTASLRDWPKGRAFGDACEARWRPRGNRRLLLLLSDAALTPEDTGGAALPEPTALFRVEDREPLHLALWGELQDPKQEPDYEQVVEDPLRPHWYEERVPQFLAYPWDEAADGPAPKRAALLAVRYRVPGETEAGNLLYRFRGLERLPPPGKERR